MIDGGIADSGNPLPYQCMYVVFGLHVNQCSTLSELFIIVTFTVPSRPHPGL